VQNRGFKTDKELLEEIKNEGKKGLTDLANEFGDDPYWIMYGKLVDWCRQLTWQGGKYETQFTIMIILTIVLAGILVGLDTYPQLQDISTLATLDIFVVCIFVFEIFVKVIGEGTKPWNFFSDGEAGIWNTFDFIVVLFSMPFFSNLFSQTPAIRIVSRLFRLVRVTKIVNQIPALQVIVKGLVGGIKSIVYVVMLLLLIFYMYAVFGVFMFKDNDPFFFRSIPIALLTLFRVCTLENWGDNMYINMYGCKEFDGDVYLSIDLTPEEEYAALPFFYQCSDPNPQFALSLVYFVSFIVISSLVMLSLFIGVITMSMQESLNDMRREVEEANRKKRLLKAEEEMEKMALKNTAMLITKRMGNGGGALGRSFKKVLDDDMESDDDDSDSSDEDQEDKVASLVVVKSAKKLVKKARRKSTQLLKKTVSMFSIRKAMSSKERKAMRDMAEMKSLMMQAWSGTKISAEYHTELDHLQEGKVELYLRHAGMFSRRIVELNTFNNFITGVILFTAVMVGVETDYRTDSNSLVFDISENIIFGIFAAEVVLRFAADDFHFKEYFKSSWNTFDFLVVALSKVPGGGTVIVLLRLVRLLRVLKLVKSLPQLSVIVSALLMGISSIGYISVIMFLTFYLFGILGVMLFSGNDDFNFGTLHRALVALFKIATLDAWGDALYINFYGCDVYPPYFIDRDEMFRCPEPSVNTIATVTFFTCFVLIGALVMITLFVGVVTTSMEEATRLQMVEFEIESRIRELCNERSVTTNQLDIYRRVFAMLDLDGGGTIEGEELRMGLQAVNIECNDEQLEGWMKEVDENSDGVIDLIEFIIFMTNMKKKAMEEQEKKAMRKGADAFLRMRAKAQSRKNGTLVDNKVVPIDSSPKQKPGFLSRQTSSFFASDSDTPGTPAAPSSPGFLSRQASAFFHTDSESPGLMSRMGSSVGKMFSDRSASSIKYSEDVTDNVSDFGADKDDKMKLSSPKQKSGFFTSNAQANTTEVLSPEQKSGHGTPQSGSSDGADKTADLTENSLASTKLELQPLDDDSL
jgi:voltage-gated sodium channel